MANPVKVAVVAETKGGAVRKIALEMLAEARRLAGEAGGNGSGAMVGAVVIGPAGAGEPERLAQYGADRVVHVAGSALESYAPEAYAEAV